MNFNDYVLEAADVNDISMMDVELTQTLAEMAVLEAMMDCYEKQMVLLEYNEDSADEIFAESEAYVPQFSEYITEADTSQWRVKPDGKDGYIVIDPTGKKMSGKKSFKTEGEAKSFIRSQAPAKANCVIRHPIRGHGEFDTSHYLVADNRDGHQLSPIFNTPEEAEYWVRQKYDEKIKLDKSPEQIKQASEKFAQKKGKDSGASSLPTSSTPGTPGPNATASSDKVNDQWNGDAAVSGPSKSFSNSFKKFMSKAGTAIQQLVLGLVDAIFEVNFEKLKEKVLDKGADFEVKINKNEFDKLHRLTALIEVTNGYYEECSLDKLKSVTWTKAKVGAYVNTVKELEFELVGAENENDEGYAMNKDDFAELCDKLGHGEFKKKLRKCQKEVSAANIDYNVENQIPPVVGKELRKFVNYLIKAYQDTSKCFTKVLKFAEEVGAKAMERSKNGGVDYGTAKNAKRLEQRQKMLGKINDMGNFSGKVNDKITASRAQQAAAAWAEEGWSMNLEEDESFF